VTGDLWFSRRLLAICLGQPLLMIPVENHIEQYLNACDAERAGIGVKDSDFRLVRLLSPQAKGAAPEIRRWIDHAGLGGFPRVLLVVALRFAMRLFQPAPPPLTSWPPLIPVY
jgi:hypothetical protein